MAANYNLLPSKLQLMPNCWKSLPRLLISCWCSMSSPNSSFIPLTFSEKIDPEIMRTAFSIWSVLHCIVNLKRSASLEFLWSLSLVFLCSIAMVVCLLWFLPRTSDNKLYQFSTSVGYTSECNLCEHKCVWLIAI